MAQRVKNPLANAGDTTDESSILGQEDSLQKEMATWVVQYSRLGNSMDKELMGYSAWGQKELDTTKHTSLRVGHDWVTSLSIFTFMH